MENNVNVEMNSQPEATTLQPIEVAAEVNSKIPHAYQEWYKLVKEECEKARALANETAEAHISETNKLLFVYFHRGYTLGIRLTKSELSVYQILPDTKKNTLTCFPIPHNLLLPFSKIARREFFASYLQKMKEEYGDFKAYETHLLGPEEYIESVLPWAKTVPKTQELSKNSPNNAVAPTVEPDCDNDIELIFSRRNQPQH